MDTQMFEQCKKEFDYEMVKYVSSKLPALTAYLSDTNYQHVLEPDPDAGCEYIKFYCIMQGHKYAQLFCVTGNTYTVLTDIIDTVSGE